VTRPAIVALALLCGCKLDFQRMLSQRRVNVSGDDPERIALMEKGSPPVGAVAHQDRAIEPGLGDGCMGRTYLEVVPVAVSADLVARGRLQFARVCATCHGAKGDGVSPVAQAMEKKKPPSLLLPPARDYPPGRLYRTVMVGYDLMPSYRDELTVRDAWAVTAYVQSSLAADAGGPSGSIAAAVSPGPACAEGKP
jgi:mono/diheme cytochrome c family protein